MNDFIICVLIAASFSTFLLMLAVKWKMVEWIQVHGNDFFSKLANCDFCLSWWANVIVCFAAFVVLRDKMWLLVPFVSTMISRKLI